MPVKRKTTPIEEVVGENDIPKPKRQALPSETKNELDENAEVDHDWVYHSSSEIGNRYQTPKNRWNTETPKQNFRQATKFERPAENLFKLFKGKTVLLFRLCSGKLVLNKF